MPIVQGLRRRLIVETSEYSRNKGNVQERFDVEMFPICKNSNLKKGTESKEMCVWLMSLL